MKKLLLPLFLLTLLILLFTGCTKDEEYGNAGDSYIEFVWDYSKPHTFATSNGALPSYFYYATWYKSNPGTYSLYYETYYGVNYWWSVDYTLTYRPGRTNNVDGTDSYFSINCTPNGPFFTQVQKKAPEPGETMDGYLIKEVLTNGYVVEKDGIELTYKRMTKEEFEKAILPNKGIEINFGT